VHFIRGVGGKRAHCGGLKSLREYEPRGSRGPETSVMARGWSSGLSIIIRGPTSDDQALVGFRRMKVRDQRASGCCWCYPCSPHELTKSRNPLVPPGLWIALHPRATPITNQHGL
jgi:hypothetical protein